MTISQTPCSRSPHEVLDDHLTLAAAGDWQTDLERNVDEEEMAFLEWTAHGPTAQVRNGAASFLNRNGRIVVQTIHYTVETFTDDT